MSAFKTPRANWLLAVLLCCVATACSRSVEARRDLVLVIAGAPGTTAPWSTWRAEARVHQGPPRHPSENLALPTPMETRTSLLTGTRHANSLEALRASGYSLMWIAQRSGRQVRAVSAPGGLTATAGYDDFKTTTNDHRLQEVLDSGALLAAWQAITLELNADFEARERAFIVLDFGATTPDAEALAASVNSLKAPVDLVFVFDDPASADRLWAVGPTTTPAVIEAPFDPREGFEILLGLGRIQLPSIGQSLNTSR